jgi:hypothetical protein
MEEKHYEVTKTKTTNKREDEVSICHFSASTQGEFDKELLLALKDEGDNDRFRVKEVNAVELGQAGDVQVSDFREIYEGIYGSDKIKKEDGEE